MILLVCTTIIKTRALSKIYRENIINVNVNDARAR